MEREEEFGSAGFSDNEERPMTVSELEADDASAHEDMRILIRVSAMCNISSQVCAEHAFQSLTSLWDL